MPYSIRLPDGTLIDNIPDDVLPEEAKRRIIAAGLVKAAEPKESTVTGELVRGAKQLVSSARTGLGSITSPEEAARAGIERGQKISEEAGVGPSFAKVKDVYEREGLLPAAGEVISQIPRALAGQVPQLAAMAGGARMGAMAGAMTPVPGGALIGGALGAGATLLPQFMGANVERQAQEQIERDEEVNIDRTKAYGAAAAQAAVEGAGTAFVLGKRIVKGVLGVADDAALASAKAKQELVKTAQRSLAGGAAVGAARGTVEIPVEIAQAVIERAQAGLDLTSPDALEEYGENAYLAGLVGPTIGGVAGPLDVRAARKAIEPSAPAQAEDEIDRLRREQTQRREKAAQARAVPPVPDTNDYAALIKYSEEVKQLPKSKERNEALKQARERRLATIQAEVEANRLSAEKAKEFMTAEEAAAAEIQRRDELELETAPPTEKIEEPKVRQKKAAVTEPTTGLTSADIEALGISKKQPITKRMLGKDMNDPEQQAAVLADIENYLVKGLGTEESRAKLTEFKARFEPATTEEADVGQAIAETGGVSVPVVSESSEGTPTGGAGITEPSGVVSPVEDAGKPADGEGRQPVAVTEESAAPAPTVESLKAEQQKLLTKSGRVPAAKSKARAKYDEIQEQIDKLNEKYAFRSEYEPPVLRELDPKKELSLRIKLQKQLDELRVLEQARDKAEGNLYLAEITGNEEAKIRAADALEAARLVIKKADEAANRTYAQIFDLEKAELEGAVGQVYVEDLLAEKAAKEKAAKEKAPDTTKLPYTLTTAEAVREEIEYELPHTLPEYKAYIEKFFTPDRKLKKSVKEEDAVREGQQLLKDKVLYRSVPRTPVIEDVISHADLQKVVDRIEKALGGQADITILDDVTDIDAKEKPGTRAGATIKGKIYLFRSGIEAGIEGEKTIFHEVFHKGLKNLLPDAEYRATMLRFYNQSAAIREAADGYLASEVGKKDTAKLSPEDARILAVEEALAEFSETNIVDGSKLRQLGNFFAKLTDRFGMPKLARAIRTMGLNPLQKFIREAIQAGIQPSTGAGATRFASKEGKALPDIPTLNSLADNIQDIAPNVAKILRRRDVSELMDLLDLQQRDGWDDLFWNRQLAGADTDETLGGQYRGDKNVRWIQVKGPRDVVKLNATGEQIAEANELYKILNRLFNEKLQGNWGSLDKQDKLALEYGLHPSRFDDAGLEYNEGEDSLWALIFSVADARAAAFKKAEVALGPEVPKFRTVAPAQKAPTLVGEKGETVSWADRTLGENKLVGARVKFADSQAAFAAKVAPLFGGKVRSKSGELNPEFQMARMLDWGRFSLAMQEEGMLKRDPDGLAVVKKLTVDKNNFSKEELKRFSLIQGEDVSVVKAFQKIAQSKTGKEKIDELLAGEREYQLYQKREELEEKGKELKFFYTEEQATALHNEFMTNEEARVVGQMLDAVRFKMIDFLVDTGRWSAEKGADMKAALGYMPFQRINALDASYEGRGTRRGAAIFRNLKKYEGSEVKQVRSPTEAFSNLMDWMTAEGMKNEATSRSLDVLSLVGAAKRISNPDQVDNAEKYKVIPSYDKGAKKFYMVNDPALVPAFSIAPVEFSSFVKLLQQGSRILRIGVTSTPPFVFKQIVDDITRLYALSKLDNPTKAAATMLLNFPKNWFNELRGAKSAGTKELENVGVVGTYDFTEEGNVTHIMEKGGLSKPGMLSKVYRIMEAGAKASDISVRQAIYDQAQKEGKDKATAEYMAREIINFSRRGSARGMDYFIRTIPFFNAFAQGFDKLVAAAGGRTVGMNSAVARATFWQRAMVLTSLGTMYALLMSDDEEYNNLSDHVRDRNIIVPFNREFVEKYGSVPAIPLPADLAFLFKAIPERVVQYYKHYGTDEERSALQMTKELTLAGFDVFSSPNLTPQLIRPIFENYINHSFFLGRPLESQSQQRVSAYLREGMGTSDTMKLVAEKLDEADIEISPIKLENFVRGMFGSIAGMTLALGDTLINPSRTDRPLHLMLGSQLTGASAFMKDALSSKSMERLYNLEKKTVQAYNGLNKLVEENKMERADQHYAENYGLLQVHDQVQELMRLVGDLSKVARQIDKDTSMTPEERRLAINELRTMQNEYSREITRIDYQARQAQLEFDKQ